MILPSLQSVLLLLGLFALCCLWGSLSYWVYLWTRGVGPDFLMVGGLFVVAFLSIFLFVEACKVMMLVTALMASLCAIAASLERQMNTPSADWEWYFLRMFAATYQSFVIGLLVAFMARDSIGGAFPPSIGLMPLIVVSAGLGLTPPSISVLRWMLHTSKLRPGLDRHFKSGDTAD